MKRIVTSSIAALALSVAAVAADLVNVSGASKIAVAGYDTVAFFTDSRAVNGSPSLGGGLRGATGIFASGDPGKLIAAASESCAPRNRNLLRRNSGFEAGVVPDLQGRVGRVIRNAARS